MHQFFVVWNPAHGLPRYRHDTLDGAVNEAKRLASVHPGQQFHVLQSVLTAERADPVTVTRHEDMDDDAVLFG